MRINKEKVMFLMAEKGLNQKTIAERAGISRSNVSTLLDGRRCRPETAAKIAKALDVPVSEIFDVD